MKITKIIAAVLAVIVCVGLVVGCSDNSAEKGEVTTEVTTEATEATAPVSTKRVTVDDLFEGMTEEEIEQAYKDLEDLGMVPEDLVAMLYGDYDMSKLTEEVEETTAE